MPIALPHRLSQQYRGLPDQSIDVRQIGGFEFVYRRDSYRPKRQRRIRAQQNAHRLGLAVTPDEQQGAIVDGCTWRGLEPRYSVEIAVVASTPVHVCPDVV